MSKQQEAADKLFERITELAEKSKGSQGQANIVQILAEAYANVSANLPTSERRSAYEN